MPPPRRDSDQLVHTVDKLRADLAKQKRRLDKAARKETELETLLLSSERDIEALRATLAACQRERDQQRAQSQKFTAALKKQHQAHLNELKRSHARLQSTLEQRPSKQQFQELQTAVQHKTQQLEALSKQAHDTADIVNIHSTQLKQKDVLLLEARQQLSACELQLNQYEKQLASAVAQSNDETRHFETLFAEKDGLFDELKEKLSNTEAEQQALQTKLQHTLNELEARPSVQDYKSLQANLLQRTDDLRIVRQDFTDLRARAESLEQKYNQEAKLNDKKDAQVQNSSAALEKMRQNMSQISEEAELLRCKGQQQARQIEEQQDDIEKSKELLAKAESQANSMKLEFETSSQAFHTERDGLLKMLEEARALIKQRPDPEQHQQVVSELEKKCASAEQLHAELVKLQELLDASKQTSGQQAAMIREKESSVQGLEQQLSQAQEQMMAMKSQFESQLNLSYAEKREISARMQMVEEQLSKRPHEEEYLQLKSALEHNVSALAGLQGEKDNLQQELNLLRANYDGQQLELNEKQNLLLEAKNELVECETRVTAQEAQHRDDLKRFDNTLAEKDAFISELKLQLQDHQEHLSSTTAAFEKEREQMQLSVAEVRENASVKLKGLQGTQEKLIAEVGSLKTQVEDGVKEHELTKKKLEMAENTICLKDSALSSLCANEEKLRKENKDLSTGVTKLRNKLRESDRLLDEASKASKSVVQIQNEVHAKEVVQLRAEVTDAKSAMDKSSTLLRRVVQRVKQVCVSCIDNEEVQRIEVDDTKSVSELQILANNFIVSIEEHLRNRIHLQSELQELECREDDMKRKISSLEAEKEDLENTIANSRRAETETSWTIQKLTKKANELEKLAVSYKLFSEESEKRLQSQEEAAEVTLTSLSEELRMKEDECEHLLAANKTADRKLDQLSDRLKEKERLEEQINEMQYEHVVKLKSATHLCEQLESEKTHLVERLEQTQVAMDEAKNSVDAMTQSQTELQSKCDSLETERDALLGARSSMETRNRELEKQIEETNNRISILSSALEEKASLQAQALATSEVHLQELDQALATSEVHLQELEALRVELKNKTESSSALEMEFSKTSKELEALREALNHSEVNLKRIQEELNVKSSQRDSASKEIVELQGSLHSAREDRRVVEERAQELQKELELSCMERNEAASQVIKLNESLESVTKLSNSLQESVQRLETDLTELRAMNGTQEDAMASLERNLKSKEAEVENASTTQAELLEKVASLEFDIKNSALLFDEEKESLRDTLEQENIAERTRMQEEFTERFRKASEEAETTGNQLRLEISLLEERLRSETVFLATERDGLETELSQRTAALCDAKEKLNAAVEQHQSMARQKEKLENELEGARQVLKEKQTEIQNLNRSLEEKDVELQESNQRVEAIATSMERVESELSKSQDALLASQSRSRDEQSTAVEKLYEAEVKNSELEQALRDSEDASAQRLAEAESLSSSRIMSLQEESQNRQQEVDRLLEVETHLRADITSLSARIHEAEGKCVVLEKSLQECEDLATKRLVEIERLNTDVVPSLKEVANVNQQEVERLSAALDSTKEELNRANTSAIADQERTLRNLEMARQELHQSERVIIEREAVIEQLRTEQEKSMAQVEGVRAKMDEIVRQQCGDTEHLQQEIEIHRQQASEYGVLLQRKETQLVDLETDLQEARQKCAQLEKEKERISLSVADSQDSHMELNELQRVHEKLLVKVLKLQRRTHRAEMLLQHEKKKHAVIAKKLDVESKRQVSPSTKGLSPAMKRPRAHSLRPPLSPRDGNSRPPLMPNPHHARRSLDFGA